MKWLTVISAALAVIYLSSKVMTASNRLDDMPDQTTSTLEDLAVTLTPSTYDSANVAFSTAVQNQNAFLDMLSYSEGTSGPDGYSTMFGGSLCDNLNDHPRQYFSFTNSLGVTLKTSAAGRYQFLARTWDELAAKLALPDFGPASQDAAALELVRQRGALADVQAGRIVQACTKCAPIWASLPGAGYNQPERKISQLLAAYTSGGGQLDATA
jgi:muramidase (phage lysozyme)